MNGTTENGRAGGKGEAVKDGGLSEDDAADTSDKPADQTTSKKNSDISNLGKKKVVKIGKNVEKIAGEDDEEIAGKENEKNTKRKVKKEKKKEKEDESQEDDEEGHDDEDEKNGKRPKKRSSGFLGVVRDILVSAAIVSLILISLYAYAGVWPPMVVIESSSMMHGNDSQIGIIDTGDLTLVKAIKDRHDVITYVEATCSTDSNHGFKTYGDYGNVIVYRKNGLSETPVIHRAIAWIEYNATASNPSASNPLERYRGDISDIHVYNVSEYTLNNVGYLKQTINIRLSNIFAASATSTSRAPHSGFVTHGDHNPAYVDQEVLALQNGGKVEPTKVDWVVGKAEGELPWFGLFKLWITGHNTTTFPPSSVNGLIVTVILLVVVPITVDFAFSWRKKQKEKRRTPREKIRKDQFK